MKILYIAKTGNKLSGVLKKINDTVLTWNEMGLEAHLYNEVKFSQEKKTILPGVCFLALKILNRFYDFRLGKLIKKINPDIIYWRFGPVPLLQRYPSSTKIIVESNSNLSVEKNTRSLLSRLAINLYRLKFISICSGVVGVTPDCLEDFKKVRNKKIIGNGIFFDKDTFMNCLQLKRNKNSTIAIFLGSPGCTWHGLDKLINIARIHTDIEFVIVGYEFIDLTISSDKLPVNIFFKGYLSGDDLKSELKKAHFAIGSLAMERAGMSYSSSLKNRTYLQYALPILMQGEDLELTGCNNILSLPVEFNDKDVKNAIDKITKASYTVNDTYEIEKRIGTYSIEKKRVDFLKSLF